MLDYGITAVNSRKFGKKPVNFTSIRQNTGPCTTYTDAHGKKMMKIALKTLGCRLNEAEIQAWSRDFQQRGATIVNDELAADLLVLNTCAVTSDAVRKSRHLIRRSQRRNPNARLIVSGCYASLDETVENSIEGIDLLVHNRDKDRLVEIAADVLEIPVMPSTATGPGENPLFTRNRSRAFIKIQDGCRYRCTFCIVTVARGKERSLAPETIIERVNAVHAQGVQEIVLTGVHAGGYGSDINSSLPELIRRLLNETAIPRIRMGSVEPWDLGEEFFNLFNNPRFMPHLHLPLQSGCDSVLKRMARRCRTADFQRLVQRLRESVPGFNLTTDIIVGFPGETEDEWCRGLNFIESIGFSHMHIFSYSPRQGTAAAAMPGQVPVRVRKQRSRELHDLMQRMKRAALEQCVGQCVPVLWESGIEQREQGQRLYGYTPAYQRVETGGEECADICNRIIETRITGVTDCGERLTGILAT